jgi:VCBS repeat-containing protein
VTVNDAYSTSANTSLAVTAPGVLWNDTDPDEDTLNAIKVSDPAHGTVALNPDGRFTYTPSANYTGADSFTYKANDGRANSGVATVTLTITAGNLPPVLAHIGNKSVLEGAALTFSVSATDPDGDPLTYSSSNLPAGASFNGTTRAFSWTPASGQAGSYANVRFTVTDGALPTSENITITVEAIPPNPTQWGDWWGRWWRWWWHWWRGWRL